MFRTTVCVWFLVIMAILKFRKGTNHAPFLLFAFKITNYLSFLVNKSFSRILVFDNEGDGNPLLLMT